MNLRTCRIFIIVCAILLAPLAPDARGEEAVFEIQSPAFSQNGNIPDLYTCDGKDISPPLTWTGVPEGTRSLALIVDDPDAPDPEAPQVNWVHWVLYDIPSSATGLVEGGKSLPPGTQEGVNDWKNTGYRGPCPPVGRHRYYFKLYALDGMWKLKATPAKAKLEKAMEKHILAQATLVGTFQHNKH